MGKTTSGVSRIEPWPMERQTPDSDTVTDSGIKKITTQVTKITEKSKALEGFTPTGAAHVIYSKAETAVITRSKTFETSPIVLNLTPDTGQPIVEGSVFFKLSNLEHYYDRNGIMYRSIDARTGGGLQSGTINYATGECIIMEYAGNINVKAIKLESLVTELGKQSITEAHFRTPGAPVRPGSFYVSGVLLDGTPWNATADFSGVISGDYVQGGIDVETGVVNLYFGGTVSPAGNEGEEWYSAENIRPDGKLWVPIPVAAESIAYNCVIYSYLPLDADLIGIDPVRLPTDGRVPIIAKGDTVVVHNTLNDILPASLTAGQEIALTRQNISLIELYDTKGLFVPSAGRYTVDLKAGKVTISDPVNLAGFEEPLTAMHRIEDMVLVIDTQINGQLALFSALNHDYEIDGTYVSSAIEFGDLAAKVTTIFDQKTWPNRWSDTLIGDSCVANYNSVTYPFVVTNRGSIAERWLLKFTSATTFDVIGENVGVIVEDHSITKTCGPINPATSVPYFTINKDGWGAGWATGNCVRFNTFSANHHLWIVRTTLPGPVTEPNDQFTLQIRGDAD
ncbi:MAG: hypothetical protein COA36_11770 [Desulfotalea sp.]|nr:MAG: hypothetical protein COA36_11770 [Desulfotalea sp.]